MPMKRMKARQDFIALDLATNESFENSGAFRSWILALDATVGVRVTKSLAAALHLRSAGFRFGFRLWFDGKIAHVVPIYRLAR
jgi:hypothetical protein